MRILSLVLYVFLSLSLHAAEDPCKNESQGARGVCRAYWSSCANNENADRVSCLRLRELYTEKSGKTYFPWENPPPPPVTCPCTTSDPTFASLVNGTIPIMSCINPAPGQLIVGNTTSNCNAGVILDSNIWYCAAACSASLRSKDAFQITAEEAAKCFLTLEAAADAQGVSCLSVAE